MPSPSPSGIEWLLESAEPWTRYRTLIDLLDQPEHDAQAQAARADMLAHPQVQGLIDHAAAWPGGALRRHNDSGHAIYALSTLADFGVRRDDPGMAPIIDAVVVHQAPEGAFQSLINIPRAFGGNDEDTWSWLLCDAPTLLYSLLRFGLADDVRVRGAVNHLADLVAENGWRCAAAPELGKFRGPGRRTDPCPIANVYALKVLAQVPKLRDSEAAHRGAEMLLGHWQHRREVKYYLFGMGSDFGKLKWPFVWYDILHVADVLSQMPTVRHDDRLIDMVQAITAQADAEARYTAGSMYRPWVGWSFADKKHPSPWLTFLVARIARRMQN